MSTRSMIGMVQPDGRVFGIYCHYDGNREYNGNILATHYQSPEKIQELMGLGDLSSLGEEIGEKHEFSGYEGPACTAYGRDRGEANTQATPYVSESAFWMSDNGAEYWYLWKDGKWFVKENDETPVELTVVPV